MAVLPDHPEAQKKHFSAEKAKATRKDAKLCRAAGSLRAKAFLR